MSRPIDISFGFIDFIISHVFSTILDLATWDKELKFLLDLSKCKNFFGDVVINEVYCLRGIEEVYLLYISANIGKGVSW